MATIDEIMSRGLLAVEPGSSLQEAARQMDERHVGAALVLEGDALRGIVTERDVLRAVAAGSIEGVSVSDCMTHHPETIDASETTGMAASLMIHGGFRHLPVLDDDDRVVGIVSIRDLMRVTLDDETPRGA
jgi:CBS domain-containing protein